MLDYLARHTTLAVPTIRHTADRLLLMDYVDHHPGRSGAAAQEDAARQLAALHGLTAEAFGFERDTVIGALAQPNPWTRNRCDFYRQQPLLALARLARASGRLPPAVPRAPPPLFC